eukprot:IDg10741t1
MADNDVVHGITLSNHKSDEPCVDFILGKDHRAPIPKASSTKATEVFELVHSDVLGPLKVPSVGGN